MNEALINIIEVTKRTSADLGRHRKSVTNLLEIGISKDHHTVLGVQRKIATFEAQLGMCYTIASECFHVGFVEFELMLGEEGNKLL